MSILLVSWSLDLDPLLDGSSARLAHIMKRPRPTYHIKTMQELTKRESFKAHLRKREGPIRDSLHGDPSRVSSPPAGHLTAYGKFVMDKNTRVENTKRDIYQRDSEFPNPLFFEILIFNKEEHILPLKLRYFIPKIKGRLANHAL